MFSGLKGENLIHATSPPVDLYLISEKSIWKNQIQHTGFLVYFELDFYCLLAKKSISKLFLQATDHRGASEVETLQPNNERQ